MTRTAVFSGSFDPPTWGHVRLIERILPLFDEIIVAIGCNSDKKTLFSTEERLELLQLCFQHLPQIKIKFYSGLTVDFCRQEKAQYLIRGIRNSIDFEYEKSMAQLNSDLCSTIETVFIVPDAASQNISSSLIRELIKHHGNFQKYLPEQIKNHTIIKEKIK